MSNQLKSIFLERTSIMSKKKTKKVMTITRERALKLFSYFNYKMAGKWSSKRMEGKLAKLPEMIDIRVVNNSKVKAILEEIANASSIEVITADKKKSTEDKSVKEKIEKRTGKKTVKKTAKKKVSKKSEKKKSRFAKKKQTKTTTKKTSTKLDKFGSRIGSTNAEVNTILSKKPLTMAQIVEEVGGTSTFYSHMKSLVEAGRVEKTDKGYKLK